MKNKILAGAGLTACLAAFAAKDPVVMTVNGEDVMRSEFEYLFHKNMRQQLTPLSLDDYAAMFEIYKLKVADAKAAGLDTLESFRREMNQYKHELALPYLTDSLFLKNLAEEYSARAKEEIEASHIMVFKTRDADENRKRRASLDSVRNELLKGADFEETALRFSADPSVKYNKGNMGFIQAGRYPYSFETAVWTLPKGELSEIVESPVGYHIIKSGERRKAKGKVEASHIMTMVSQDATPEEQAQAKSLIDSLYTVVSANPARFAEIATKYSADPGSARQGGKLPAFGRGEMVPEFEAEAYSLQPGEISKPVRSMYGWHIIKKHGELPLPDESEAMAIMTRRASNPRDEIGKIIKDRQTKELAAKHKGRINTEVLEALVREAKTNGLDSVFFVENTNMPNSKRVIATVGKKNFTVADYLEGAGGLLNTPAEMSELILRDAASNFLHSKLIDAEEDWLYANEPDYRNLLKEYNDGSLLYEISLRKVWDKASSDTAGLQKFFETNKSDYKWTQPRVKGWLVQAVNDSVAKEVRNGLKNLPKEAVSDYIKKNFNTTATAQYILTAKGQNPIVDYLYYGEGENPSTDTKYQSIFLYEPRQINNPEEVDDVRGSVVSDYQNELERQWVDWLKATYPVKVNSKQLKKVK